MNPATPAAVQSAVNILLESICNENRNTLEMMSTTRGSNCRTDAKTLNNLLAHADDHAEAIKSTLNSVQRQLLEKMSAFHTEHNKMIPLHQLPIEIFVRIITGALGPLRAVNESGSTRLGRVVTLRRVCKHWRKVIEGTPSFWTTIDVLDPPTITSNAISRSGSLPLNIIATDTPYRMKYQGSGWGEFSDTAITVSTRWRSVQMLVDSPEKALAIMNAPAPLLQALELKSTISAPLGLPEGRTAFQGTEPQLRRLRLDGVSITWDLYPLRGLRSLTISGRLGFYPSCEEMLGILRMCSSLVELDLSLHRTAAVDGPNRATQFALAEVQYLSLSLSPPWTLALLETIRFPSIQSVSFNLELGSSSDQVFPKLIQHTQALFSVIFDAQYKLLVDFSHTLDWTCEPLQPSHGGRNFKIAIRYNKSPSATKYLVENLLRRFPAESIQIHFKCPFEDLQPYLKAFDGVNSIKHILAGAQCNLNSILKHMSGPTPSDKWGLPELEGLTASYCEYDWKSLLSMVEARYGTEKAKRSGSTVSGHRPDLPPPLKWVRIRQVGGQIKGFIRDSLQFLEKTLGSDCFEFDADEGSDGDEGSDED